MTLRFDRLFALVPLALLALSLSTLPLAMAGLFKPALVIPAALVLFVGLWWTWTRSESGTTAMDRAATVAVVAIVLVITAVNVRYSSQHILTERDPGAYNTTAQWLSERGTLLVDPEGAPYRGLRNEHRIHFRSAGYYEGHRADGKIYPQFAHLLPATLGAGAWVGGVRGMLKINALLGGLALLAVFAFASKLMRPWAAVGATTALGLNLVQIHFTRDAYTEIITQALLFGGLWALWVARENLDPWRAGIAGLLVGSTCMARIDAFALLVPVAGYVVVEAWVGRTQAPGRRVRVFLSALSVGVAVPAVIGWFDLRYFSPVYLNTLAPSLRTIWLALAAVVLGGGAVLALRTRLGWLTRRLNKYRPWLAGGVVLVVVIGALYAYVLRPTFEIGTHGPKGIVEFLQQREGLPIEPERSYAEQTLRWIALYLGPVGLAAGLAGLAFMLRETVLGKVRRAVPFLLVVVFISGTYVWKPDITPDHMWAMRRFLPVTIPGFLICGFWLADRALQSRSAVRWVAGVAVAAMLVHPLWALAPVLPARTQVGTLRATEQLCAQLPDRAAVIVAQTSLLDLNFTQTVRGFCDVPAATAPMDQPMSWYRDIARRWATVGRALYVISPQEHFGTYWPLGSRQIADIEYRNLERSLSRPDGYETFPFTLYLRKVSP